MFVCAWPFFGDVVHGLMEGVGRIVVSTMDIHGDHLGCPRLPWGVHGNTGGSYGMGVIWTYRVVRLGCHGEGAEVPTNGPKGPQPSAALCQQSIVGIVFIVNCLGENIIINELTFKVLY